MATNFRLEWPVEIEWDNEKNLHVVTVADEVVAEYPQAGHRRGLVAVVLYLRGLGFAPERMQYTRTNGSGCYLFVVN